MSTFIITTDNNADLPESYMEQHGIGCSFLSYQLDGKEYKAGEFLPVHEFYERMRGGSMPTTAQVTPQAAQQMMEPYLEKGLDILHIAFSSGLSGSYNSSVIAAQELQEKYPQRKIVVVDSLAASLGQGLLIHLVVQKKEQGCTLVEAAAYAEEMKGKIVHAFTVNDLFHLFRGGRVSRTTAVVGSMLNIKPVLHVDDEGKLVAVGKARGRKKSLHALVDMMDAQIGKYKESCDTIFISHGDCPEDAEYVANKVKEKYPVKTVLIHPVGATIGAHSGPGTVALFFVGEKR